MTTEPGGGGAAWTLSEMLMLLLRPCASAIWTGRLFRPVEVFEGMAALKEKILSPPVASPFVPSSKNCCADEPPIELRSPATVSPVLVGLAPGVTVTVSSDELPACTGFGLAAPVPVGGVGTRTVRGIVALPVRACASVMVAGRLFAPPLVPPGTVELKEKTLSPAVTSPPLMPSSKNCWVGEPPMAERSALTASPVLIGLVPGVTVTVRRVVLVPFAKTELGLDAPVPEGFVGPAPWGVTEKSSMARPWSLPASSTACQRSQISCPLLTVTGKFADFAVRLAAALPSRVAAVAPVIGLVKLNVEKVVHPPVGLFAPAITPELATWY